LVQARSSKVLSATLACTLAAGCTGTVIPSDGPSGARVEQRSEVRIERAGKLSYALVKLSPLSVSIARTEAPQTFFSRGVGRGAVTEARIGIGDTVSISIFEAGSGGLFIPSQAGSRPGNFVNLPAQQVDRSGVITVPYAGEIRAVGRTPTEIGAEIEEKLRNRAIEPQVVVNINERRSNEISVLGDVNGPTRFSLDPGGTRLLAAVARAGGSRFAAFETVVTIQRQGRIEQAPLSSVVKFPAQNINLSGGDTVFLSREPRIFLAFGATPPPGSIGGQNNRRFLFENENLTLAEAVAKAGGLADLRADPKAVFLFRMENRDTLRRLGVNVSGHTEREIPTIYQSDLSDAEGYFLANNFFMRHKDMIYVSDAPSVDLLKFLNIVSAVSNTTTDVIDARNAIFDLSR
jgi:polysaccharide export outer membrane protein